MCLSTIFACFLHCFYGQVLEWCWAEFGAVFLKNEYKDIDIPYEKMILLE